MTRRAIISVYNKDGIVEFARALKDFGYEIISTGGTMKYLRENGIEVINISDITNFPEILDGRVKTLHPNIHAGILAIKDNQEHVMTLNELNISPIDMVVVNLYPFKETIFKENVTFDDVIENIDIGGPTMLRAAAKNFRYTTVVIDPADYGLVIEEMKEKGDVSFDTRFYLATKVFEYTAYYDSMIFNYFKYLRNDKSFSNHFTFPLEKIQELRYGENPHQQASFYRIVLPFIEKSNITNAQQLHGKELSFNNILDSDSAIELLKEFDEPTCVAIKHNNPCAVASSDNIFEAFKKVNSSDPVSIFGGIVAFNRKVDRQTAEELKKIFLEVVIAPDFDEDALALLSSKKDFRILKLPTLSKNDVYYDIKSVNGGVLVQERDRKLLNEDYQVVTERKPEKKELEDLIFAWKVVKHVKSNAIVIAKDKMTLGIGMGQTNRIWAVEHAIARSRFDLNGSVLASDAFFPFSDSVEAAGKAGITAIIQPGGSIRDKDSIDAANKYNIAMIFTGIRHFRH
ncbi:bifunctional phosphoribosylaminoimidazolecarboxamide formyltransferase/IMP cyclohydrolase [Caldicellulosiruptor morganii]|uniref:Bifunctional purine biosynthesis protein PurH n=1 Tax=Caldicellulosiruptor morganii TaxID=1387555 RepID=A0ABY7BPW1_9FIRM|nr:bifunctional phosphoribosylaminoimidazolecarboxamide formyltransferase/IMP cyclohydrolase [Caldicellulosiruptor morganii]WAM34855.1 bifunctional phosphoribosylaminoimidazolecarboxamide formyltransferase/IMP cyclohydrolase [Caldicellulosiruptor morganii]